MASEVSSGIRCRLEQHVAITKNRERSPGCGTQSCAGGDSTDARAWEVEEKSPRTAVSTGKRLRGELYACKPITQKSAILDMWRSAAAFSRTCLRCPATQRSCFCGSS